MPARLPPPVPPRLSKPVDSTDAGVPPRLPPRPHAANHDDAEVPDDGRMGEHYVDIVDGNFACEQTSPIIAMGDFSGIIDACILPHDSATPGDRIMIAEERNVRSVNSACPLSVHWTMQPVDFFHPTCILLVPSSSSHLAVVGTSEGHVLVLDAGTGRPVKEHLSLHQRQPIVRLIASASEGEFASVDASGRAILHCLSRVVKELGKVDDPAKCRRLRHGQWLVTEDNVTCADGDWQGTRDGRVASAKEQLRCGSQQVTAVLAHCSLLWVCDASNAVKVVDLASKRVLCRFATPAVVLRLSTNGLRILAVMADKRLGLWDASLSDHHALRRSILARCDRSLRIRCVTWNVGGCVPPGLGDARKWRHRLLVPDVETAHDCIVVALQEVVDLGTVSMGTLLSQATDSIAPLPESTAWQAFLCEQMQADGYSLAGWVSHVGLALGVFCKGLLPPLMHTAFVDVNGWGTKGAVAIRFVLPGSGAGSHRRFISVCIVNGHLPSGEKKEDLEKRNGAFEKILADTRFPPIMLPANARPFIGKGTGERVWEHDVCIVAGDLNYRLEHSAEDRADLLQQGSHQRWQHDQLQRQLCKPTLSVGRFAEAGELADFSYKYDRHTNRFDTSEKQRWPAFCDRVLLRADPHVWQLQSHAYHVLMDDSVGSDHKPVVADIALHPPQHSERINRK